MKITFSDIYERLTLYDTFDYRALINKQSHSSVQRVGLYCSTSCPLQTLKLQSVKSEAVILDNSHVSGVTVSCSVFNHLLLNGNIKVASKPSRFWLTST